jgi:hypothetical protein
MTKVRRQKQVDSYLKIALSIVVTPTDSINEVSPYKPDDLGFGGKALIAWY